MTGIAQCKLCKVIFKFAIISDTIKCPNCGHKWNPNNGKEHNEIGSHAQVTRV